MRAIIVQGIDLTIVMTKQNFFILKLYPQLTALWKLADVGNG
jgi:hypothetical protein